jgi:clan AA aspartic protease
MLTGIVTAGRQAMLDLEVLGQSGRPQKVETVVATGFDGQLILPRALIAALALRYRGAHQAILADGKRVALDYYRATVMWHGRPRTIDVLQSGPIPLLGMELLEGSMLTVDASPGGAVTIEEIP